MFKVDCSRVEWQVATSYTNKIREMTNKVSIIQTPFISGFTHLIEQKRFLKSHIIYRFRWGLLGTDRHTHTTKKKKRQPFISHLQSSHDQSSLPFSHTQSCLVNKKNYCFLDKTKRNIENSPFDMWLFASSPNNQGYLANTYSTLCCVFEIEFGFEKERK